MRARLHFVEHGLAARGGMQELKDMLPTVVWDSLQQDFEAEVSARLGAGRSERSENRNRTKKG